MSYYFNKTIEASFDEAIERVTEVLKTEGFGVLSRIDVDEKFREKLGKEFRRYTILGACSPAHAYEALKHEDKIGTMLPCNVILQDLGKGRIEVAAINPIESMMAVKNPNLGGVAVEVKEHLALVIEKLA